LLAVPKLAKEKSQSNDIRLCIDAQFLNKKIVDMVDNNLPLLRDVINKLGKFEWISVIDLADSYHQFPIRPKNQPKLAFLLMEDSQCS
jgi:hypothetical protein